MLLNWRGREVEFEGLDDCLEAESYGISFKVEIADTGYWVASIQFLDMCLTGPGRKSPQEALEGLELATSYFGKGRQCY